MLKKSLCALLALTAALSLFTGCSSKSTTTTISNEGNSSSSGNGYSNENIDLKLCAENVQNYFKEGDFGLNDIAVEIPTEENNFFNIILITEEKPEDNSVYVKLCKECLAKLNEEAIRQDPQYAPAKEGYYGGLFDQYTVSLTATCLDDILKLWPVNQTIDSGKHDSIVTNNDIIDLGMLD